MKKGHRAIRYNRSTVIQVLNFHQACSTVGAMTDLHTQLRWRSVFYFEMQLLDLTRASINVET